MAYDRDIVVGCNKRHYDLLIRMAYLDPAAVRHPPPEGWSDDQLAVDVLQYSNRSDAVIDLLQHLPYNVRNTGMVKFEVYIATENTCFLLDMGYPKGTTAEKRRNTDLTDYLLMPYGAVYPPGFIALSQGNDEVEWMVDTEEGIIWPVGPSLVNDDAPENQPWRRGANPRDIQEYFDEIYSHV